MVKFSAKHPTTTMPPTPSIPLTPHHLTKQKKNPPSVPPDPEQGRQRSTKDVQPKHAAFFTDAIWIQRCEVDTQKARHTGGNVILPRRVRRESHVACHVGGPLEKKKNG